MDDKEKKVKGTVILDYVRMIRRARDKDWDKYLEGEDWDMINGRVLASVWYPYDHFRRCGKAVFREIAGGNVEIVRQFGKINAETLFKGTYKSVLESAMSGEGGIIKFLERYVTMTPTLFNFVDLELKKISDTHVEFSVIVDVKLEQDVAKAYFYQLAGTIERLVEMSGGKNPRVTFLKKYWEGDPRTTYDVSWE